MVCKYLLLFQRLSFHIVNCFFCCTEVFRFNFGPFIFAFAACTFDVISKKPQRSLMPQSISFAFSSRCLAVPGFTLRSLIHFELIFVYKAG